MLLDTPGGGAEVNSTYQQRNGDRCELEYELGQLQSTKTYIGTGNRHPGESVIDGRG